MRRALLLLLLLAPSLVPAAAAEYDACDTSVDTFCTYDPPYDPKRDCALLVVTEDGVRSWTCVPYVVDPCHHAHGACATLDEAWKYVVGVPP